MQTVEKETNQENTTWIELSKENFLENLSAVKELANDAAVLAIIKANAYGHGLLEAASILDEQVTLFGVNCLKEAEDLKKTDIKTPALILGRLLGEDLKKAILAGHRLTISSYEEAEQIATTAGENNTKVSAHVKVDTGMGRLGIPLRYGLAAIEKMAKLPGLHLEGLFTHLPSAEKADGFTKRQLNDLKMLKIALESKDITFDYYHATNSCGLSYEQEPFLNMVRPGLMLYGVYPQSDLKSIIRLKPVLSLKSRLIHSKSLLPGQTAGYGRHFEADGTTTIGVIPFGYSHWYPFSAWEKSKVLYEGK